MSNISLPKFGIAFGLLGAVLIFLGVNYVPRIYASSSAQRNVVVAGNKTRINYIDEQYQRAIAPQLSYFMSDWIERHPSIAVTGFRTPPMSNYIQPIGTERFFTPPPMSNNIRPIGTERFFTPPPADYTP